jgi:hypothetical protein
VAKAVVVGAVTFAVGLLAAGIVVPVGKAILRANGSSVLPVSALTEARVIVGAAAVLAVAAVLALALAALLRRGWPAVVVAVAVMVLPYLLGVVPVLPDNVSEWLLRVTPAAGFTVLQTLREYPQVIAHYAPSAGYFPLAWWAGFAVLCAYTAVALGLATLRLRRRSVSTESQVDWR